MKKTISLRFNFRLDPTPEQSDRLAEFAAYDRGLWNLMLSENIRRYAYDKTFVFYSDMSRLLKELKQFEGFAWLKVFDSAAAQQTCKRLDKALREGVTKGNLKQFPTHKASYKIKKLHEDSYTAVCTNRSIEIKNGQLKLPKIGWINIKQHRKMISDIKTVTLKYRHGHWYASFTQEKTVTTKGRLRSTAGYDINSQQTVVGSNGITVNNPKYLKRSVQKLKQLQRQLSRRVKGSARWKRTKARINTLHGKISRQRLDFSHKLAFTIAKCSDLVLFEDLNVKGMQQFNGSMVADNVMGNITSLVKYKVDRNGGMYHEIYRFAKSTGVCVACHHTHALSLNEREFICESCGTHQLRDASAASTIERIGIDELIAAGSVVRDIPTAQEKLSNQTKVFKRLKFDRGLEKSSAA